MSLAVGSISQLDRRTILGMSSQTLETVLAFAAAALSAIAAAGGFDRKWRANRRSRAVLDGLLLDLQNPQGDINAVRSKLKHVILAHDREILAEPE